MSCASKASSLGVGGQDQDGPVVFGPYACPREPGGVQVPCVLRLRVVGEHQRCHPVSHTHREYHPVCRRVHVYLAFLQHARVVGDQLRLHGWCSVGRAAFVFQFVRNLISHAIGLIVLCESRSICRLSEAVDSLKQICLFCRYVLIHTH